MAETGMEMRARKKWGMECEVGYRTKGIEVVEH